MQILITHKVTEDQIDAIKQVVPEAEISLAREEQDIAKLMPDSNIIWGSRFVPELLPQCKQLAFIQVSSAGVDRLISPELLAHPAQLINARGIHGTTIAEHVFMLMLALARQLPDLHNAQAKREWTRVSPVLLSGKTMVIVGYGSIGRAIAKRAKAFHMRIIGLKRRVTTDEWADEIWTTSRLNEAIALADYLVLATPLTEETHHLIGDEQLTLMKDTATLINIARGPVVDEQALIAALKRDTIKAGLDVFEQEPLPADSELWNMPNVLVTPHNAGDMPNYDDQVMSIFLENLRRYKKGEQLINLVDKQLGY